MARFIYAFSEDDRDALLKRGYNLMKSNENIHQYVFEGGNNECFALDGVECVESNVLTF